MLIQTLIIHVWLGRTVPDLWEVMSSKSCRPSSRRLSFRALWLSTLSLKLYTHMNTKTTCQCKGIILVHFFPLLHAFCPLRISLLSSIRTSSHAHAFKKTSSLICQEDCIVQRLLFHCPRELMGESNQKLHPDFHLPQIYKEKCCILHRRILTFLHSFHET